MQKLPLLGAESIAQGAIDGGLSGVYAYPGTPSTEITEYIQKNKLAKDREIHSKWSANEKTAMESALGMSYAGKRSMVCMKHVGLNVAADAFMNSAITGVNGGLLVIVADDPSMHSSQNEQDTRYYGKFAMIPVLEPSNQQEAYDMAYFGFSLSEKYQTPVLIRITTRLSHSRADILRNEIISENNLKLPKDPNQYILLPSIARKRYKVLLQNQEYFSESSEDSIYNKFIEGKDHSLGIIASGIAYNYLMENFQETELSFPLIKIGQYPLPVKMINKLANDCDKLLILEEGYPIIEESMKGILNNGLDITGRLDGTIPRDGELTPIIVAKGLGLAVGEIQKIPDFIADRPPSLCQGCGHADTFEVLNHVMENYSKGRVFSDIGCYTLGALPPFESIDSCVDMGASVTMAKGAADAGLIPSIAVIGDSTFTHSGMTGLLDAINENSPITVVIVDNSTTGMTGGQQSAATGKIEDICLGLGVDSDHIRVFTPLKKKL